MTITHPPPVRVGSTISRVRELARSAHGLAVLDQLIVSATNFGTGVILGRACSQEDFGLYMLGLTILYFAMDFQTALISSPYTVFSPRLNPANSARYAGSTLVHHSLYAAVIAFGLTAMGGALRLLRPDSGLATVFFALAAVITFILLREFVRRFCFARFEFSFALRLDVAVAAFQLGFLLLAVRCGFISPSITFVGMGLACALGALSGLILRLRLFEISIRHSAVDFVQNWNLGKWIVGSGLVWTLIMNSFPWILAYIHGTGATGVWAACFAISSIANPVIMGMQNLIAPKLAHSIVGLGISGLKRAAIRSSILLVLGTLPLVIVFVLFGGILVASIYGPSYDGNGSVVALLGVNLFVSAFRISYSRALFAIEAARMDCFANLVSFATVPLFGFYLISHLSVFGLALSIVIANIVASTLKVAMFRWVTFRVKDDA